MRQTNFAVGTLRAGYETCYGGQFKRFEVSGDRKIIDAKEKNNLERSHWDHSRSWSQNFKTEQLQRFTEKKDPLNFTKNKFMGYQNTLNQIDTHYKLGYNPTLFETTTLSKFRDNSAQRAPVFATRKAKDYQETHHFNFGKQGTPMMTSTWSHFSKRFVDDK
mmetsp:Transcript_4269/g.7225  ORF Transcript_4269/g.7225 Transcript_4269/m.7225 type:complete len:162 (-) Transcript_4269:87-572(-)